LGAEDIAVADRCQELGLVAALRTLAGLKKLPSLSTFGDWFVKAGAQGLTLP